MSLLKKTVSFVAIFAAMPAAFAVTARPSVIGTASARMPTMTAYINTSGSSSSTTNSTLLANNECIEAYTSCLKGGDVCGPNFEECTNNTLFYAKKPQCASTLVQCSASGINALFGTSNQTAFSNKNSAGEYVYPTSGSVLGQLIEAAHINNRYDTSDCVKKYTSCLKKDDVCGYDFELCTSNEEFKKQKLFCESTLARCQEDGLKELFGTTNTAATPSSDSRIGIMISEGAALAAVNAVSTCYKVVDQCFLNACSLNPYKCKEGTQKKLATLSENIKNTDAIKIAQTLELNYDTTTRNEVSAYLRNSCLDTIGANKFCYATFIGNGVMPTSSQLKDEDNKQEVYDEAYNARMNDSMRSKIDDLITQFDKKAKEQCAETIVSCAMRTCGEGSGAACYASAFNSANKVKGVTNPSTMADIKTGCEAVVNSDVACQYAAATFDNLTGSLLLEDNGLFDKLFTAPDDTSVSNPDPVGAVATLNAKLSTSYNQAALDGMKKQCQAIATNCVKSMCGADYQNCYRNRTDVYSSITNSGNADFDSSMNKVGGVLDHTIVIGLCMNTVKNADVCNEHIKAEIARKDAGRSSADSWGTSWGVTDARSGWLDAGTFVADERLSNVQDVDADGNLLCTTLQDNNGDTGRCDDASGKYIYPKMIGTSEYNIQQAERAIFRDLVYDLEIEAQAKYNAKLTKQQNMCLSSNSGGIMGSGDLGSTFMWAKLKSNKVPADYAVSGLKETQFTASNELYGSFCRVRVTIQSDDPKLQTLIKNERPSWANAYFAAGDAFTCGSWIPYDELERISEEVGSDARADAKAAQPDLVGWMSALGAVGGLVGGGYLTDAMQDGDFLGGLLGTPKKTDKDKGSEAEQCVTAANRALQYIDTRVYFSQYFDSMIRLAEEADAIVQTATDCKWENGVCSNSKEVEESIKALKESCQDKADSEDTDSDEAKARKKRSITNAVGAGITGIAGGILGWQITESVQNAELDSAQRAAMQEWMDNIGKHIRCYVGSDEIGQYGDVISTSME